MVLRLASADFVCSILSSRIQVATAERSQEQQFPSDTIKILYGCLHKESLWRRSETLFPRSARQWQLDRHGSSNSFAECEVHEGMGSLAMITRRNVMQGGVGSALLTLHAGSADAEPMESDGHVKTMGFIKAKRGLSGTEFRRLYELHALKARKAFPMIERYVRNYIESGSATPEDSGHLDFAWSCVTEMWFANQAAYDAFNSRLADVDVRREFSRGEADFVEPNSLAKFVVREVV
jgi:hypothetical protein